MVAGLNTISIPLFRQQQLHRNPEQKQAADDFE